MIIVQDLHNALCTASELGDYFSANELEDHVVQGTWKIIIVFFYPIIIVQGLHYALQVSFG